MNYLRTSLVLLLVIGTGCAPQDNGKMTVPEEPKTRSGQSTESRENSSAKPTKVNDIGIATLPTPAGWLPNRSNGNTALIFVRVNASQTQPDEMISIDLGKASAATAKESAEALAKKFGGTVSDFTAGLDGETAFRVSVPPNYKQLMPRECLVAHRADQVCFVFGGSKSKADIWPVLLGIAETWEWN